MGIQIKKVKKKLKKFRRLLKNHGTTARIPIAPPGFPHKDKSKYNRKKSKKNAKKEIIENT